MSDRSRALARGAGDVGSAVAVVLYRAGYTVALHDPSCAFDHARRFASAETLHAKMISAGVDPGMEYRSPISSILNLRAR